MLEYNLLTPDPSLHHTLPYTTPLPTPHPSLHHTPPYHHTPTYYHTPINVFSNKLYANKFKSFGSPPPPPLPPTYIYCPRVLVNLGGKHHCLLWSPVIVTQKSFSIYLPHPLTQTYDPCILLCPLNIAYCPNNLPE